MLTYSLKKTQGLPLYEALYRCIRADIHSGALQPGQRLPSRRALAANLKLSTVTVDAAYGQLLSEGYLRTEPRRGYFVEQNLPCATGGTPDPAAAPEEVPDGDVSGRIDLTTNHPVRFPFSVWRTLERQVMLDYGERLLRPLPHQGIWELRQAIAAQLDGFRGIHAAPQDIVVGAGTDFLYNLLLQLLGRTQVYAVEEPGYEKISSIYRSGGAEVLRVPVDGAGVRPDCLGRATVVHLSPSHHFPTGAVTSHARRLALLDWAERNGGWIIEDDYDSEFRFGTHPLPAMQAMDRAGRVIYMNSFTKSLAPSIRVAYMVLPPALSRRFRQELGFYGCTVSSFEQYTLARFLRDGHFEKHINRMRKFYRARRNRLRAMLEACAFHDRLTLLEQDAGLHFLVKVDTELSDEALTARLGAAGIDVRCLGSYYHGPVPEEHRHCLVVNYSGLTEEDLSRLEALLSREWLPFAEGVSEAPPPLAPSF